MDNDLAFSSATRVRQLIADGELSPVELTETFLSRIDSLDDQLNSFLTVASDYALATARRAEEAVTRGDELGPLHGIPISIKDLEMTAGIRTTSGSLLYEDRVPEVDSTVVERIRAAGAIILGKTNTPEWGLLGHTENRLGDHCRNPWNTSMTTGGSSGGAGASLAAGLCSLATGSDGGGSIRIPASFCGVYGIKPTQGRVPLYGGLPVPAFANLFSQSGPMSRTVRDSALLLQVLAGHDPRDASSLRSAPDDYVAAADRGVQGLRVGWSPDFGFAAVDPDVQSSTLDAVKVFGELGAEVEDVSISFEKSPLDAFWTMFSALSVFRYSDAAGDRTDLLTDYTRAWFKDGAEFTGSEYVGALGERDRFIATFADVFENYDLIVTPSVATTAFPVGDPPGIIDGREVEPFWGYVQFSAVINLIGYCAASIPCGFDSEGLPIGLHIIGRPGDDATVLAASAAFEEARPWADRRPPVS